MLRILKSSHVGSSEIVQKTKMAFDQLLARKDIGFHQLPERDFPWSSSEVRAKEICARFSKMVILGIGGSSLGGRTILSALARGRESELEFFENVDALEFWRRVSLLDDLPKTHFVLVSKSGNTMETLSQAAFLEQHLRSKGLEFRDQATVISEARKNPLTDWAEKNQVPVLEIPIDVGGRFSVLTPVGLLPAAFLGVSLQDMRKGARAALKARDEIAELSAQTIQSFERKEGVTLFWFYSDQLATFGLWVQQLWAESLAKATTRGGAPGPFVSTPMPLVGANDQHSVLQQVVEGTRDKWVWLFRSKASETTGPKLERSSFDKTQEFVGKTLGALLAAEARATAQALREYQVPCVELELDQVGPQDLAYLFMFFELIVGTVGECLNIDAYNQPGVELGKRLARDLLKT